MIRCLLIIKLIVLSCWSTSIRAEQIIVSIKPLALIVKAVAPDSADIVTLIPPGASPHTYQLKPTQVIGLSKAKTIYWLNPAIETGLGRQLAKRSNAYQLHLESIQDHGDMHAWMNPTWALKQASRIVKEQNWPTDKLAQFTSALQASTKQWQQQTASIGDQPVVVAHDAFNHWRSWANFNQVAVVQPSAEHPAPASHLFDVDQMLQAMNHSCIVIEPSTPERTKRFLAAYNLPMVSVDIIGYSADSYQQLMQQIADGLSRCATQ